MFQSHHSPQRELFNSYSEYTKSSDIVHLASVQRLRYFVFIWI